MSSAQAAAEVFLQYATDAALSPPESHVLGASLVDAFRAGERRWPEIGVPELAFYGWLARQLDGVEPDRLVAELSSRRVVDLYLACACALGIGAAKDAFIAEFADSIRAHVRRLGVAPTEQEDLVQELLSDLLVGRDDTPGRIQSFRGRSSLKQWLAVIVANRVIERARRQGRRPAVAEDVSLSQLIDLEAEEFEALRDEHQLLFRASVKQALGELEPKKRLILLQHYVDRMTLDQLAKLHAMHHTTVSRWLRHGRQFVADRTRELVVEAGISPTEYSSVVRIVQSQLDLTLSRFSPG